MDNLSSLLKDRAPNEPPQVTALKRYAQEIYSATIQVQVGRSAYVVTVPHAALAHRFRIDTMRITDVCSLDKPLIIRIGY